MHDLLPDMSKSPSVVENYRYSGINNLPFAGTPDLLNPREYSNRTVTSVRAGYGNFDTADPEATCCNRTLLEVLTKAAVGEYRINNIAQQWIRCEQKGVRLLYFVQWTEYIDRDRQEATQLTSRHAIQVLENSR